MGPPHVGCIHVTGGHGQDAVPRPPEHRLQSWDRGQLRGRATGAATVHWCFEQERVLESTRASSHHRICRCAGQHGGRQGQLNSREWLPKP